MYVELNKKQKPNDSITKSELEHEELTVEQCSPTQSWKKLLALFHHMFEVSFLKQTDFSMFLIKTSIFLITILVVSRESCEHSVNSESPDLGKNI
jgi:hypothetical protein